MGLQDDFDLEEERLQKQDELKDIKPHQDGAA
jgi:hypothetical protein